LIGRNLHGLPKTEPAIKVRFESVAHGLLDHSNSTLPKSVKGNPPNFHRREK